MKYLKLFEGYQTESEVAEICKKHGIENWSLNNGLVDVRGDVDLPRKGLTELPLKFGEVTGCFNCSNNKITSLEGAPKSVGGYFDCNFNVLKTLEGAPHTVGANFRCEYNQLNSLEGAPNKVTGVFYCRGNNIRSFEGLVNISGDFYCGENPVYPIWYVINQTNKWDSEKMEFFNDLDIIRGEEIAIERLNFFLEEIGLDPVESVKGYKNI